MNTEAKPMPEVARRRYRIPVIAAVILLLAMGLVWWSFFALRADQSVRVLFSAGTFSKVDEQVAGSESTGVDRARGTSFRTGADGFATVQLSDGSIVKLMPNARLDIEDARANSDSNRFSTSLRLFAGEIEAQVKRGDGVNREVNLFSKSVAIGVRGTIFSVIQDDAKARVMVTRGRIEAQANVGAAVPINSNEGTVVAIRAAVQQVVTLPAAPLPAGDAQTVTDGVRFVWRSAAPQNAYQVEIAEDDAFTRVFRRHVVNWQQGTLPPVEHDGQYFWRVASINAQGLRGVYSDAAVLNQDYFLRRSRAALAKGDLSAVRANLALADKALDEEIDRLRDRALLAVSQRRFASAVTDLELVVALRNTDVSARNGLAGAHFELLDYTTARRQFETSIRSIDVGAELVADAQAGIALIDVRQGKFADGLQRARGVLALHATHLHALNVAAMASVALNDPGTATQYLQRALAAQPDDATALSIRQSMRRPPLSLPDMGFSPQGIGKGS